MTLIVELSPEAEDNLKTLAAYCGRSAEELANIFIGDGIHAFKSQQNELRDNLDQ